jgi:hypothetical protein
MVRRLNLFHIVDEKVEVGFTAAARGTWLVNRARGPDRATPQPMMGAAEGDVDDEDQPTVRMVATKR